MRNRRLSARASETKSGDRRCFGPCGRSIGARVPSTRLRPPQRQTCKRSSLYKRRGFVWFVGETLREELAGWQHRCNWQRPHGSHKGKLPHGFVTQQVGENMVNHVKLIHGQLCHWHTIAQTIVR